MVKVIVECKPDEILVQALGLNRKEVRHQNNKGEVCNYLKKSEVKVAIIDEDPGSGQPNYLKEFKIAEDKCGIRKLLHKRIHKVILIIKPRLEEWVIDQCKKSGIDPERFHLPSKAKELKKNINLRLPRFHELIEELYKHGNEGLKYLENEINQAYK